MVEAVGVEPTSEDASERTSTRVGTLFEVSSSPAVTGLCAQQADFVSTSVRQRVRRSSLIVSVHRGYRRKLQELSLPGFIRQREQRRCYRSQLQVCPFLRGHGRHDARSERHHPRRNRYAPMSKTVTAETATCRHYGSGKPHGQGVPSGAAPAAAVRSSPTMPR